MLYRNIVNKFNLILANKITTDTDVEQTHEFSL